MEKKFSFTFISAALFILGIITLNACNNDKEDVYEGYGMIKCENGSQYSIILDDGHTIIPQEGFTQLERFRDSTRVQSIFTILNETPSCSQVNLITLDTILTKDVLPYLPNTDSAGHAPVMLTNAWLAHGFLNFEFAFVGDTKRHMVNLLQRSAKEGLLEFEFRHKDFDDERTKTMLGIVSFRLHPILTKIEKNTKIIIRYNDTDSTTKIIELIYNIK